METKEKETELVQLIRQLKDYVILERKDYEKLVQNSSPEKFNESALGDIIGHGYTPDIDPDKEEHNLPETEKYFQRWTKRNNIDKFKKA